MNTPRILIVEDEALIAMSIGNRVQRLGYQVSAIVSSGEEAVRAAIDMRPDVVLMDIKLRGEMDGIEAAAQIRERCDVPVVYLTAYANESILQRAKITSPFGYIVKPFLDQDLHNNIEIALYRHEQEQRLRESEERYRSLFDDVPVGLYRTTPAGQILDANPALVQMMGYPGREALLAINVVDVYADPEDRGRFQTLVEREKGVRGFQVQMRRRDGAVIWVEINAQSISDADGQVLYYKGSVEDITARKQAKEALRQERDFAESLIETAQTIVLVLDTKGRIVRFNPYMEEVSGYRLEEVQGKDWFATFLPRCDHKRIRELFLQAVSDIQTRGNVNPIVTKDGHERQIEWHDKTLKDADGNVVGLVAVGQDITERVQAEKALQESEERFRKLFEQSNKAGCSSSATCRD